jgi:hypothetical protein
MAAKKIDRAYLLRRSEEHLIRAARASDDSARVLHQRFADLYRARANGERLVQQD